MTDALRAACKRALHVVTPEGRVLAGGRACLFVLGRLGWPRLARALATPPVVWLVEAAYRLVARSRGWLGRLLGV